MNAKHEKIYDLTGIDPLWWNDAQGLYKEKDSYVDNEPHYPCEQLWEMLPEVIETYYNFGINKKGLGYLHAINSEDVLHWVSFNNLHEALLDMVLWAIEQKVIKK